MHVFFFNLVVEIESFWTEPTIRQKSSLSDWVILLHFGFSQADETFERCSWGALKISTSWQSMNRDKRKSMVLVVHSHARIGCGFSQQKWQELINVCQVLIAIHPLTTNDQTSNAQQSFWWYVVVWRGLGLDGVFLETLSKLWQTSRPSPRYSTMKCVTEKSGTPSHKSIASRQKKTNSSTIGGGGGEQKAKDVLPKWVVRGKRLHSIDPNLYRFVTTLMDDSGSLTETHPGAGWPALGASPLEAARLPRAEVQPTGSSAQLSSHQNRQTAGKVIKAGPPPLRLF